jgi:hypothetical protein
MPFLVYSSLLSDSAAGVGAGADSGSLSLVSPRNFRIIDRVNSKSSSAVFAGVENAASVECLGTEAAINAEAEMGKSNATIAV